MSTHMLQSFFKFFASFCIGQISHSSILWLRLWNLYIKDSPSCTVVARLSCMSLKVKISTGPLLSDLHGRHIKFRCCNRMEKSHLRKKIFNTATDNNNKANDAFFCHTALLCVVYNYNIWMLSYLLQRRVRFQHVHSNQ